MEKLLGMAVAGYLHQAAQTLQTLALWSLLELGLADMSAAHCSQSFLEALETHHAAPLFMNASFSGAMAAFELMMPHRSRVTGLTRAPHTLSPVASCNPGKLL